MIFYKADSMLRIEKAVAERDYNKFARLLNAAEETSITSKDIAQWDRDNAISASFCQRYAAILDSELVGYGLLLHSPSFDSGRYKLWLTIDEAYRKRGFGQSFYEYLLGAAKDAGADTVTSDCLESSPESLRFAEKQGFGIHTLYFESLMELESFEFSDWQECLAKVEAQGIRFSSLADEGFTEEAQRKLYQLNLESAKDNPSDDGSWNPTFEQFKANIYDSSWFDPEAQLLAIDGEVFVGLSAVGFGDDGTAFTAYTGVDKEYRGRGIALALKVLASHFVKSKGAKSLPTNNDSRNLAMLAINKKLGYKRQKGTYMLKKLL
jgi:GNAT superfamily N-acetyltransferase